MQHVTSSMTDTYPSLIQWVLTHGTRSRPRGLGTTEILDFSLQLTDPTAALPTGVGRKLNTKIAAVEALQLMGGVIDPPALVKASPVFKQFMDGGSFHGGYGQRTRSQLPAVVNRLRKDPHTRQAIATIWDPLHDLFTEGVRDYPCTLSLQFLVRDSRVVMLTHMRSNDAWRGLAYDVFVFTQLQQAVAAALGLKVGTYHHHVGSFHIYDSDLEAINKMMDAEDHGAQEHVDGLFNPGTPWESIADAARSILEGDVRHTHLMNKDTLQWYTNRM